jgi:RNA polymerase sigma-70 factor (ECF subfamily)
MMTSQKYESTLDHGDSLQAILCPHVKRLVGYLDHLIPTELRRSIDPQDVAQDAFFHAARAFDQAVLDGPDSVWRWLATIGRNRVTDILRERQAAKRGGGRLKELHRNAAQDGSVIDLLSELAVHERTPSKSAVRRELVDVVEQSIGRIDAAYREAIHLRYVDGLSLEATAARMSRSEDSVQKLCARGLKALRRELRSISLYS